MYTEASKKSLERIKKMKVEQAAAAENFAGFIAEKSKKEAVLV
jgi:hypothetical protein